jgi:hypothetical protein
MKSYSDKVVTVADFVAMEERVAKLEAETFQTKRTQRLMCWIGSAFAIFTLAFAVFH